MLVKLSMVQGKQGSTAYEHSQQQATLSALDNIETDTITLSSDLKPSPCIAE